jgi:peptidase M1-like protein
MKPRLLAVAALGLAPLAAACSSGDASPAPSADPPTTERSSPTTGPAAPPSTERSSPSTTTERSPAQPPAAGAVDDLLASLSASGQDLAAGTDWEQRPRYDLYARVDAASGSVDASMRARLPVGAGATEVHLRWFPGVAADEPELVDVAVDGRAVEPTVDESLVTVPLTGDHGDSIEVTSDFRFTAPGFSGQSLDPLGRGDALDPAEIGLLARSDDALVLGHWFPIWIPDGLSADPELDGYGDIANFPAATIVAELEVPDGATVVTSGVRLDAGGARGLTSSGAGSTIVEGGIGLRDLGVVVMASAAQTEQMVGDTRVVVTAPDGSEGSAEVLADAAESVDALSGAFGAYPWTELDVVATSLGASVGGMEWPGMVWIEQTIFGGGIPGMGDLGGLGELGDLSEVFGDLEELGELGEIGEILGGVGGGDVFGDIGLMVETVREWTVAHEVGHQWWHAVVGNDSLTEAVIDEPLAQHSACLVERARRGDEAADVCAVHTAGQYTQMRTLMGIEDGPADRPSEEFDSSMQYGAVVYGKAPGIYRELEERYGVEAATDALAGFVTEYAFDQVTPDELRAHLGEALGDPAGVDALWIRWMEERHGDEDLAD